MSLPKRSRKSKAQKPKSLRSAERLALEQLKALLSRYPNGPELDIDGLILDYIGRSGEKLDAVFKLNPSLYPYLFAEDPEKGLRLLQVVGDPDIVLRCGKRYPLIAKVLASRGAELCAPALLKNPSASLGYKVRSVVWHISDAHFGKFYKLKETPRELAFLVAQLARDYPDLLPDVILISGDVSSIASQLEFEQFRSFCRDISAALWKQACPERILVVPLKSSPRLCQVPGRFISRQSPAGSGRSPFAV